MKINSLAILLALVTAPLAACGTNASKSENLGTTDSALSGNGSKKEKSTGTYNLHLEDRVRFAPIQPGSDPVRGRQLFGLAEDLETSDTTLALFEGQSRAYGGQVVSNGRSCFTCHRGLSAGLGLPKAPLSATIPLTDPLFTGIDGDSQGDPDGMHNLDQLALVKIRPHRFVLPRPETDPFRRVFGWRKSIRLINLGLSQGFLHDGRGRALFEVDRGAVFSHTQVTDERFDELFTTREGNDMQAFQFSNFSDPRLADLRDPNAPLYKKLVSDAFYTVNTKTKEQRRGQEVFEKNCMTCHNTPNVFNNLSNVEALGNNERPPNFPTFAPAVGRLFDIGIAERNTHNLRFTHDNGDGTFTPIVLPLAKQNGDTVNVTVTFDPGLAAITARYEDLGRFKVPQLRGVKDAGPYFHDNSMATLEDVVDYFNGDEYNRSADGKNFPIHLSRKERSDLLEFLQIL